MLPPTLSLWGRYCAGSSRVAVHSRGTAVLPTDVVAGRRLQWPRRVSRCAGLGQTGNVPSALHHQQFALSDFPAGGTAWPPSSAARKNCARWPKIK